VRSRRSLPWVAPLVLAGVLTASCGGPDRSAAADELRVELAALPGVADATVRYTPRSLELAESVRYVVTVDPAAGAVIACAVVAAFVDGLGGTGIDADRALLELRDTGTPPLPWAFTVQPPVAAAATAEAECVTSQEVRAVPIAYAASAEASRDAPAGRPRMHLRFRGGDGVATTAQGEALARAHMPSYAEFDWDVGVICGERPC